MAWLETDSMNERLSFVQDAQSDRFSMSALCARAVSPPAPLASGSGSCTSRMR